MQLLSEKLLKKNCSQMHPICTLALFQIKKGLEKFSKPLILMAEATRLELATSGVTGYRSHFKFSNKINNLL